MELAPMTKRDKILLYFVLMVAFVVLYIRFLLIPGIENHQQAAADLVEAETAQTTMQDTILMASANAAQKNTNWSELQTLGQCLQHLTLVDAAELLQGLTDTQVAVLLLIGKGGVELFGRDVAELNQDVAQTDVLHG